MNLVFAGTSAYQRRDFEVLGLHPSEPDEAPTVVLASEGPDLPWDSSVVSLAGSPSAPKDALLVR